MLRRVFVAFLAVSLLLDAPAVTRAQERHALVSLTVDNFEQHVSPRSAIAVVLFVHSGADDRVRKECAAAQEALQDAADEVAALNPPPLLAVADQKQSYELALRHGVATYPQLKLFRNGREVPWKWRGDTKTGAGLVSTISALVRSPFTEVNTLDEAHMFVSPLLLPDQHGGGRTVIKHDNDCVVVVFAFFKTVDMDLNQLMDAAEHVRHVPWLKFVRTSSDAVMREYGHRHTFVVYNPDATAHTGNDAATGGTARRGVAWDAQAAVSSEDVLQFLALHALPLVGTLSDDTAPLYNRNERPMLRFYVDPSTTATRRQYFASRLRRVAAQFPRVVFAFAGEATHLAEATTEFGFDARDLREGTAIAVWARHRTKYRVDFEVGLPAGSSEAGSPTFSVKALQRWLEAFAAGTVVPFLRTAEEPRENAAPGQGRVIEVTGRSFRRLVLEAKHAVVLVVAYQPWCGHCSQFLPLLDRIAARLHQLRVDALVVKIDTAANEVPIGYNAQAFPMLYLATAHDRHSPEVYEGDRSLEAVVVAVRDAAASVARRGSE